MKKIFSISLVAFSIFASAQMSLAAKFNVLFPAGNGSWKALSTTGNEIWETKGKNNTGFNVGLSLKLDFKSNWFLMPELYYTSIKSEATAYNQSFAAKSHTIDIPVLLGYNLLDKKLGVYAGPMGSFHLSKDNTYNDFKERFKSKDYAMGYQVGAQIMVSKFIFSARYQGAFSNNERIYDDTSTAQTVTYNDKKKGYVFAGIGYKF